MQNETVKKLINSLNRLYNCAMRKISILATGMTEPLILEGTVNRTVGILQVKNAKDELIAEFSDGTHWWLCPILQIERQH